MRIAVTGASGFVGKALCNYLRSERHLVLPMVRDKGDKNNRAGAIYWSPSKGEIDVEALEGIDGVIHLAGESIAAGRWTAEKKKRIMESRVKGTQLLASTMAGLKAKPGVFLSTSAIGYYGERGDEMLDETSSTGSGFLADVCRQWEAATKDAESAGVRVAILRLGVVLGTGGGAMDKMLPLFKTGLGGPLGSGKQYWSWISLDDLVRIFAFALTADVRGPVNCVAPNPVTNKEFTDELARVLHKPAVLPAPDFALKLALGEMADEMLLASQRVRPVVLEKAGFQFQHAQLSDCLKKTVVA
jgi:uncharacterized protein